MITVTVILLFLLLASGMHIAVAFGLATATIILLGTGVPPVMIAQTAFRSVNSYPLLAVPFFLLAGNAMMRGQLGAIIIDLIASIVQVIRGGLAVTVMLASVFFAAVAGSSLASMAAIGSTMTERMSRQNYPPRFSAGLIAVGSTLGLMIPPSLAFILIGVIIGLPIDKLFLAGLAPGLMEAAMLTITSLYLARKHGYGVKVDHVDWPKVGRTVPRAIPALLMPAIILGSIYGGLFTPTEVSAVAAVYAILLCLLFYRTMNLTAVWTAIKDSTLQTTMIYSIFMGGSLIGFLLVRTGFSQDVAAIVTAWDLPPWAFLLMVNILLLLLGTFLDGVSLTILTAPVLFPMAKALGVDPFHFAVIMVANIEIAVLTPPVGINVFAMSKLAKIPVREVSKGVLPYYLTRLIALALITYVPAISLFFVR